MCNLATSVLLIPTKILDLQATTVVETLSSDWKDYEDATQNATALKAEADCIVTRNKKDFSESSLPVYTPAELLELLKIGAFCKKNNITIEKLKKCAELQELAKRD